MNMISDILHVWIVLLCLIPGVHCRYEYNVGGLVASTIVGVFMLALIIIMLFVIVMWRDWYERRQLMRGRRKRPREHWGYFSAKPKSTSILLSTPRSDKKPYVVGQHLIRDSRNTTLTRADEWLTKLPPSSGEYIQLQNRYEEKVQTMNFEPEEEAVIVADILPENNRRSTQRTKHDYENAPRQVNYQDAGDDNTLYIPYSAPKSNPDSRQQLRHTIGALSYHVKMGQVGESQRTPDDQYVVPPSDSTAPRDQTSSRDNGYTIQRDAEPSETPGPSGAGRESPQMMVNDDTDKPAVMEFQDSDEEAGMIPLTQARVEGDVLF